MANFGLGIATLVAYVVAALITVGLFLILSPLGAIGLVMSIVLGVLLIGGVAVVSSTLDGI